MKKAIIYQILPRLWGKGRFSSLDEKSLNHIKSLGTTHVWLTGIPRHARGKAFVKGDAGSPYAIEDWFDTNPYLADDPSKRMDEFKSLIDRIHALGMKVITDFIPNHVARQYEGDIRIPVCGYCDYDWTDTDKVDYSDPTTVPSFAKVLRFWASMGVDGFRCDMVELVPKDSLKAILADVRQSYPETLFVAEVYDTSSYDCYTGYVGFDLLYDKSGLYDSMVAVTGGNAPLKSLTDNHLAHSYHAGGLLSFLENHDEKRFPFNRAAIAYSALSGCQSYLVYFGEEVGEMASESSDSRTSIFNFVEVKGAEDIISGSLSDEQADILAFYRKVLSLATTDLFASGADYDLRYCTAAEGVLPFLRHDACRSVLVVCNFSTSRQSFHLDWPRELKERCRHLSDNGIDIDIDGLDALFLPV